MSVEQSWNSNMKWCLFLLLNVFFISIAKGSTNETPDFGSAVPIPDSKVSISSGKGITAAILSCATDRYAHGVLGDAIEAGCLIVMDESERTFTIDLPESQVFEDLEPRIADMDGDGLNDVAVVRSDDKAGAAVAIYTVKDDKAIELAATPPIGRTFRWLAPVGIADFDNDGQVDIAYVQTPHIGGILKVWTMVEGQLDQIAELSGFSNHSIGEKRVSTAKIIDYNDDDVVDIVLPDQSRQSMVWLTLVPELRVLDSKPYRQSYFD